MDIHTGKRIGSLFHKSLSYFLEKYATVQGLLEKNRTGKQTEIMQTNQTFTHLLSWCPQPPLKPTFGYSYTEFQFISKCDFYVQIAIQMDFGMGFLWTNFIMCCRLHSILFCTKVTSIHNYNTRLAAKHSYYLPYARTNYGKFNIRFQGPSVWNTIDDNVKLSSSISVFKKRLKDQYFERY